MMTAKELLDAGRLGDAVQELSNTLKTRPTDTQSRVFLFELLCFAGQYDRASKQLDAIATGAGDAGQQLALQVYRDLLAAERQRHEVFTGNALPKFLIPPPASVEQYVVLLRKVRDDQPGAAGLVDSAEDATPAVSGRFGDTPFKHFRDADDRIAPVLEAFHGPDYIWLPFEQISRLQFTPAKRLRELLWVPATVELHGQKPGEVFVPALYVSSYLHPDDNVKLGRLTEWEAIADRIVVGSGQRVFLLDQAEHPVLEMRAVVFDRAPEQVANV